VNVNLSAGAVVDVQAGTLVGSSSYQRIWTSNLASLIIAGGALFDAVEGGTTGTMQFNSLTGSGAFRGGYFGNTGGLTTVTLGVADGSGTFSESLSDDSNAHLAIVKSGSGTETFSGSNSFTGGITVSGGALVIAAAGAVPAGRNVVNNAVFKITANATAGSVSGSGTTSIAAGSTLTAGNFAQRGLAMQLAGAAAAANAKLNVTSLLSLAGTLTVNLGSGFLPSAGTSFDILDWSTLNGTFSSLQLPALAGGLNWNTSQLYTTGTLTIGGVAGDYNHNGTVDAADYTLWRDTLGSTTNLAADGNGNGVIDSGDYGVWKANYGNHPGAGAGANTAVPEPSTLVMLILAAAGPCLWRHRTARKVPSTNSVLSIVAQPWSIRRYSLRHGRQCVSPASAILIALRPFGVSKPVEATAGDTDNPCRKPIRYLRLRFGAAPSPGNAASNEGSWRKRTSFFRSPQNGAIREWPRGDPESRIDPK
jgi:autotransporter-associated beta strand protein